jgi:hypothetical protein
LKARDSRRRLRVREVIVMSRESYHRYARSIVGTAVKSCSKALFAVVWRHGKSPCFLRCAFSAVVDVDSASANFQLVNVDDFLE